MELKTRFDDNNERKVSYTKIPNECPICHRGIDVRIIEVYRKDILANVAQIVFQCPYQDCLRFFIGYYRINPHDYYDLVGVLPILPEERQFSDIIKSISPLFVNIYNESSYAEQLDLQNICGVGYRKALEFLIKDYAISLATTETQKQCIKEEYLGDVIKDYIDYESIKENAERAAWLGNDETHYVRLWGDKELSDLKNLIELTITWIDLVKMSQKYKEQMPQGKKIKK